MKRKQVKKALPKLLNRFRRNGEKLAKIRRENRNDTRLPEVREKLRRAYMVLAIAKAQKQREEILEGLDAPEATPVAAA